jgi:hypothetical protein
MKLPGRDDLEALIANTEKPCVSIYLPTHRAGADVQQDPIRLKNALRKAEERLAGNGMRSPDARRMLEPAQKLLPDDLFWRHQLDGLALFISPTSFRAYRLPLTIDELVVVADRFHVKPLLPILAGDGRFYVLAVSQKNVRLFHATRHSIQDVPLADVPVSLADALQDDTVERQLQHHSSGRQGAAAVFHGTEIADAKEKLLRFFQQIDKGLRQNLRDRKPIVLAAVDYLMPIYREANTLQRLVHDGIEGNPDGMKREELHSRAWSIMQPIFESTERSAAEEYRRLAGTGRASNQIPEIVRAAHHGRVESLFVPVGGQVWGKYDPASDAVEVRAQGEGGEEDLFDFAAIHTILQRGTVYPVTKPRLPDQPLAAIFRY